MRQGPRVKCPACRRVMVPAITAYYWDNDSKIAVGGDGRPCYVCPCCNNRWSQGWRPLVDVKTLKAAPLPWQPGKTPHIGEPWQFGVANIVAATWKEVLR